MQRFSSNILFLLFLFFSLNSVAQAGKFTFTLANPASTSAGVFKLDGTLVRTLWNNVQYDKGTFTENWDGKDDLGAKISSPAATYQIKVISNNVQYTWQGTMGNSSDSVTGFSKHRGYYHCIKGLAFGPTYGYFCTGYSEASPSVGKFLISSPNQKINFPSSGTHTTANNDFVATDGTVVYWGGFDAYFPDNTFVYGTKVSDDTDNSFSSGTSYTVTYGKKYTSTIAKMRKSNSLISGLAVQKNGPFLFVSRAELNQLQVLDKTTGALVQTLAYTKPRGLSVDANGNLWMASGTNTVTKYAVNSNGTLSPGIKLTGLENPMATQVSADNNTVTVADGGNSQQVKFYSNSTGAAAATLGSIGGYVKDPTVNNNKFYFSDLNGTVQYSKIAFIAYQADGSFWVNDPGNFRVQHYNAGRGFLNRIMSLGAKYATYVDKNNIKRIFGDFLEFEADYAVQNLTGNSGWVLRKNWGATTNGTVYDKSPRYITTLSNGRTYGLIRKGLNSLEVVEYPASGPLRFTGKFMHGVVKILCSDGSLQDYSLTGKNATYLRYPLNGFDGSGNPVWSTVPQVLGTAKIDHNDGNPVNTPNSQIFSSTNKIVLFNQKACADPRATKFSKGYHLAAMEKGANNTFTFQTEKSTHRSYQGPYPEAGFFDVGNKVNDFAGGTVNFIDRQIVTSYHGEFWKDGQTNKYNHYYDNGLAIGQFGITRPEVGFSSRAAAMMAGNALTPMMVKDANGDFYLYHGDESDHAGIHRWKITGLNTIAEQVVSVAYPGSYAAPTPGYLDLMIGLPTDQVLVTNTAGWTRYPAVNNETNPYKALWRVNTTRQSYKKLTSNDVTIEFLSPTGTTNTVQRDLGTNNVASSWKISGELIYPSGNNVNWKVATQYLDVLDAKGRVLTTFFIAAGLDGNTTIYGNDRPMAVASGTRIQREIDNLLPFEIAMLDGKVTFSYGKYSPVRTTIYDAAGDWKTPKTLRVRMVNQGIPGPAYKQSIALKDFKFYKDYNPAAYVNKLPVANAEKDMVITAPLTSVTLAGSGTDTDGTIVKYEWRKVSGPSIFSILSPAFATTVINSLWPGHYLFELKVTDDEGGTDVDYLQVIVNPSGSLSNQTPVANAGGDKIISLPINSIALAGSANDLDGSIASYSWTKVSGPSTYTITSPGSATTTISDLVDGTYQFRLTVTDNDGAVSSDIVEITQKGNAFNYVNLLPAASAGQDISIYLPSSTVTLKGVASDVDGSIASYSWTRVSGTYNFSIASPSSAVTRVNNLTEGTYQFQLKVVDNDGASTYDYVNVIVKKKNTKSKISTTGTAGGSTAISDPAVGSTLSPLDAVDLAVYPNPVNDRTNLSIPITKNDTKVAITVVNASGARVLYKETTIASKGSVYSLDMSPLPNGMYFVTVRRDDGVTYNKKVVKGSR